MPVRGRRLRILRRLGTQLPGLSAKTADRRPFPPGEHGAVPMRRRPSSLRRRLEEKQKVRFNYGVTESQMERYLNAARALQGNTGENLLMLLERARASLRASAELSPSLRLPSYLRRDPDDACAGRVVTLPTRADVPFPVAEALIIELYAR
jgi:small subunit ribosomal protein S4